MSKSQSLHEIIQQSPFRNIYWFARYLVNTDQYGQVGRLKEKQILGTVSLLENILSQKGLSNDEKLKVLKNTLSEEFLAMHSKVTKAYRQIANLTELLDREIKTVEDMTIFCITMRYVVAPINKAIEQVPSNDREFCHKTAKSILDALGEEKAGLVIATWDDLGVKGCLDAERTIIVGEFINLMTNLSSINIPHTSTDDNILLTAFVQEFERRAGQKRKGRAGNSLEDVATFLFAYYHFPSTEAPSHFDQDIEVDKWFKCKDGWLIGISCKRTLRERWKQLSQADRGTLSHFKIRELWHLITYDKDLSDDKIVRLGEQGQIFYLADDSEIYNRCKEHAGMKDYVRPLSNFVNDVRGNIK